MVIDCRHRHRNCIHASPALTAKQTSPSSTSALYKASLAAMAKRVDALEKELAATKAAK